MDIPTSALDRPGEFACCETQALSGPSVLFFTFIARPWLTAPEDDHTGPDLLFVCDERHFQLPAVQKLCILAA